MGAPGVHLARRSASAPITDAAAGARASATTRRSCRLYAPGSAIDSSVPGNSFAQLQRHLDGGAARRRRLGGPEAGRAGRRRGAGARSAAVDRHDHQRPAHRRRHATSAHQRQRRAPRAARRRRWWRARGADQLRRQRQRQRVEHDVGAAGQRRGAHQLQPDRPRREWRGARRRAAARQRHLVRHQRAQRRLLLERPGEQRLRPRPRIQRRGGDGAEPAAAARSAERTASPTSPAIPPR